MNLWRAARGAARGRSDTGAWITLSHEGNEQRCKRHPSPHCYICYVCYVCYATPRPTPMLRTAPHCLSPHPLHLLRQLRLLRDGSPRLPHLFRYVTAHLLGARGSLHERIDRRRPRAWLMDRRRREAARAERGEAGDGHAGVECTCLLKLGVVETAEGGRAQRVVHPMDVWKRRYGMIHRRRGRAPRRKACGGASGARTTTCSAIAAGLFASSAPSCGTTAVARGHVRRQQPAVQCDKPRKGDGAARACSTSFGGRSPPSPSSPSSASSLSTPASRSMPPRMLLLCRSTSAKYEGAAVVARSACHIGNSDVPLWRTFTGRESNGELDARSTLWRVRRRRYTSRAVCVALALMCVVRRATHHRPRRILVVAEQKGYRRRA